MGVELREHEVTLRDGTRAVIRPIRPDDKERLRRGLRRLSPRSRYLRFHAPVRELSEDQLRYLTEIDYRDHMAWVALNPDEPDDPGMGVARYVRSKDEPTVAEAAVTVVDRYQGRGLGSELLRMLTASAVDNGVHTFRNYVLAENRAMLDLLDQLGGVRTDDGYGVIRVDVPVEREDAPTDVAARMLRAIAKGSLPPLRWASPWTALLQRVRTGHDDDVPAAAEDEEPR